MEYYLDKKQLLQNICEKKIRKNKFLLEHFDSTKLSGMSLVELEYLNSELLDEKKKLQYINKIAYFKWVDGGKKELDDLSDWLNAENELNKLQADKLINSFCSLGTTLPQCKLITYSYNWFEHSDHLYSYGWLEHPDGLYPFVYSN